MSSNNDAKSMSDDLPYDDFMKSVLPMFSGPQVNIRVGEHGPAHHISKDILCKNSPYFAAMFAAGHFKEGAEDAAVLEEIEGVVTPRSFQALVQWLYRGRVAFPVSLPPQEEISQILELVRLADMTGVTGVDKAMSERLRLIFGSSQPPSQPQQHGPQPGARNPLTASNPPNIPPLGSTQNLHPNLPSNAQPQQQPSHVVQAQISSAGSSSQASQNTRSILMTQSQARSVAQRAMAQRQPSNIVPQTSSHRFPGHNADDITALHMAQTAKLHPDNPVRRMVAAAAVELYLLNPHYRFQNVVKDTPSFAMDLLREVHGTLHNPGRGAGYFVDPISGEAYMIGH